MTKRGFTLIELIVVIVIMGILMTLAVMSTAAGEANGRDSERRGDLESVARGLESRYDNGNHQVSAPSYVGQGAYPGIYEMQHILGQSVAGFTPGQVTGGYTAEVLSGTSLGNFVPPDSDASDYSAFHLACTSSCTTAAAARTSVASAITSDSYYYLPIDAAGNVCMSGDCVSYQLFWYSEVEQSVQTIESKHQ